MPTLIDYKVTNLNGAGTSITLDMPDGENSPDGELYASGDHLVTVVYKEDDAGGDLALTVATGWTEQTPTGDGKAGTGSNRGRYGVWGKQAASASETSPVVTTSNSDEMIGVVMAFRGEDAADVFELVKTDFAALDTAEWPSDSITNDKSLAILFWGSGGSDETEVVHDETNDWLYLFRELNNNTMQLGAYMASLDSGTPTLPARTASLQALLTIVINDDDGTYEQPYLSDSSITPVSIFKDANQVDDSVDAGATVEDPTGTFSTIDGETTVYMPNTSQSAAEWIKNRGDQFVHGADTNDALNIYRQNYNGATIDMSGDYIFSLHCSDDNNDFSLKNSLAADGNGVIVVLEDSTADWAAYNCLRRDFGKRGSYAHSVWQFQPSTATKLDSSGTIDLTDITKISFGYHKGTTTAWSPRFANAVRVDGATIIGGGGSARPINAKRLYGDVLDRMAGIEAYLQGESQLLENRIVQLGDTSVDVYADFQYNSIEFIPNTEGLTQIENGRLGLHLKPNANSTIKGQNCTLNGIGHYDFKVLSGTSASATLNWQNAQILNAYDVEVRAPMSMGGAFISTVNSFTPNDADLSTNGGVTIDNCAATYVATITTQAELDKLANCTFTGNNTCIRVNVDVAVTSLNFSGQLFDTGTANTYAVEYTNNHDITFTRSNGSDITIDMVNETGTGSVTLDTSTIVNITAPNLIDDTRVQVEDRTNGGTVSSLTRSGSTATANLTAHGFAVNDEVVIRGTGQGEYNGLQTVASVPDADSFTFTVSGTPATPATTSSSITAYKELDNSVVSGGSGYSLTYTHNGNINAQIRACYQSTTTAKMPVVETLVVTTGGASTITTQVNDTEYNDYGVDGSTVSEITPSYDEQDNVNKFEISVDDPDNTFDSRRGAAWFRYITQTEQGIREFDPEAMTYNPDIRNITISPAIRINNADASNPLTITEGLWQNSDASTLYDTTGGSIFWLVNDRVYQGPETGVSGLTSTESIKLDNINTKTDPLTFTKSNELDANIQSINGVTITGDGSATPFNV